MTEITQRDLNLMFQPHIKYSIKIEILNENQTVVDVIEGIPSNSGTCTIDASSDIRRTMEFTIIPTYTTDISITEDSLIWLNKEARLYIGIRDCRTDEDVWYSQGHYVFMSTSGTYDSITNQLTVTCNDLISKLDGTKNGQTGYLKTIFPAYEENSNGTVVKYNVIRDQVVTILKQMCNINDFIVEDIGEYKGIDKYNNDYINYRKTNPQWNCLPYDLEFSTGATLLSMLTAFRDLYPNYEFFFDTDRVFHFQMIPSGYEDNISLTNDFLQRVLISETSQLDMSVARNVVEVWGNIIEENYYTETCSMSGRTYNATFTSDNAFPSSYASSDIIAIKVPRTNLSGQSLNINGIGALQIYDENSDELIGANTLKANETYCFKYKKKYINNSVTERFYLLGQWQPHALSVLLNKSTHDETYTFSDGTSVELYSDDYFKTKYNCNTISKQIIPDNSFSIEKIGECLFLYGDGENESITSDSLALAQAEYTLWQKARLTDSITITTLLLPFLDVNQKVTYKRSDSDIEEEYIIQRVTNDFSSLPYKSTIEMSKFYPLYNH